MTTDRPLDPDRIADLLEASVATIQAERRGFIGRIRTILAGDRPALPGWDQVAVEAARRDHEREPAEIPAELLPIRAESIELVRALRPEDLARIGVHDRVGELSVGDLLGEWVHHDRSHVRQILSVVQARVWPQMGNARRFVDPNA